MILPVSAYDRSLDPPEPKIDDRDCTNCKWLGNALPTKEHPHGFTICKCEMPAYDFKRVQLPNGGIKLVFEMELNETDRGCACDNHKFVLDENI
jgi:hypothetical protein